MRTADSTIDSVDAAGIGVLEPANPPATNNISFSAEEAMDKFSSPRAQLNYLCQIWFPGDLPDAKTAVNTVLTREPAEFLRQLDALALSMNVTTAETRAHRKKLPEPLLKLLAQGAPEPLPLFPLAALRQAATLTQSILLNDQVYYWSIDLPDAAYRLLKSFRRLMCTILEEREAAEGDRSDTAGWRAPVRRSPMAKFMALFICAARGANPTDELRRQLAKLDRAWVSFERRYYRELAEFSERALLPLALAVNVAQKLKPLDPLLLPRPQAAETLAIRLQRQPFPLSGAEQARAAAALSTAAQTDAAVRSRLRTYRVRLFRMLQRVAFMMSAGGRSDLDPTALKDEVLQQAEEWLNEHALSHESGASTGTSDFASPMRILLHDVCERYSQLMEVLLRRGAMPWGKTSPWLVENDDLVDAFASLIRASKVAAKYTQCTRLQLLATVTGVLTHLVQDDVHHLLRGSHAAPPDALPETAPDAAPDVAPDARSSEATTAPGGSPGGLSRVTSSEEFVPPDPEAEAAVREAVAAAATGEEALEVLVTADAAAAEARAAAAAGNGRSELLERVACFDPTVLLNLPGVLLAFAVARRDRACENVCRVLYRDLALDRDFVRARQHATDEPLDEASFSTLLADLLSDEPLEDAEGHALGEGTHAHAGEEPNQTILACIRRCMLRLQRSRPGDWNELEQVAIFCLLHSDLSALLKPPPPPSPAHAHSPPRVPAAAAVAPQP